MPDDGPDTGLNTSGSALARIIQWSGFVAGPLLALLVYLLAPASLPEPGRRVLAIATWMATWWMTEAIPISATALLPLIALPLMRVSTMKEAAAPYADEIIFLFLGVFVLGEALQASGLHKRIAINTLLAVGTAPSRIVGGLMLATCMLSMWVSNTATTIMMLPIGISLVALVERCVDTEAGRRSGWTTDAVRHLSIAVVLGIAYAASIGGMATPIGTPPNVIMLQQAQSALNRDIDFPQWMSRALPVTIVFMVLTWLVLTRVMHRVRAGKIEGGLGEMLLDQRRKLGLVSRAEWITLAIFFTAALAWVFRKRIVRFLELTTTVKDRPVDLLTDAGIAIAAALLLFMIPVSIRKRQFVVSIDRIHGLPWGILLLFGGGMSIADAMSRTGVDKFIGGQFAGLEGMPHVLIYFVLIAAIVIGGELASNAAVVTALMPILAAAAKPMGLDPLTLMFGATLAASCGFMLPVATPPNALAYATKRVTQPQMIRAGLVLDIIGIVLITVLMYFAKGNLFPE